MQRIRLVKPTKAEVRKAIRKWSKNGLYEFADILLIYDNHTTVQFEYDEEKLGFAYDSHSPVAIVFIEIY